jgi:hypothetical protein
MAATKSTQIKVNGHWYGCIKNLYNNTYKFTKDYVECTRNEWSTAYKQHLALRTVSD